MPKNKKQDAITHIENLRGNLENFVDGIKKAQGTDLLIRDIIGKAQGITAEEKSKLSGYLDNTNSRLKKLDAEIVTYESKLTAIDRLLELFDQEEVAFEVYELIRILNT